MGKKTSSKALRRKPLSTELVMLAALKMADKNGIEALSMRKLAVVLKVEAMSLYNHVASKENILDGLVEMVVTEIDLPSQDGDWRAVMRKRTISAHSALMRHPWATMLVVSRINVGPNMLRYLDATTGCLLQAGFTYPMADHALNAIDAYLYGFTFQKLNFPLDPSEYVAAATQFLPLIPVEKYPYFNGMAQEIIQGRHNGINELEFGLELILEGLEKMRLAPTN